MSRLTQVLDCGWRFRLGEAPGESERLSYEQLKPWLLATGNELVGIPPQIPTENPGGFTPAFASPDFDDLNWRELTLPHDWGVEGDFDPALPGETGKLSWSGVAWYRIRQTCTASDVAARLHLEFDGAMSGASVWINGHLAGGWAYGYASFRVELTRFWRIGSINTIAVRIDNPPDSSRWYPGGGLYRQVRLVRTHATAFAQHGVSITTPLVTPAHAVLHLSARIDGISANCFVSARLQLAGTVVAHGSCALAGESATATAQLQLPVASPALWSPSQPTLYSLTVGLLDRCGVLMDHHTVAVGIRTVRFDPERGVILNGDQVRLNGVCLHHDLGALGAAAHRRAIERQLLLLREMGCNAIRCAHNAPAPELLELCDQLGFLAIDEFSDTWTRAKKSNGYARLYADWHERDVRAWVRRDRNHPCVILWSTGNEIAEQDDAAGHEISRHLTGLVHSEDSTRPVTVGCDRPTAGFDGFQHTVDVFGFNYKPHEYARFRQANPSQPLYGSETSSCISSRGFYVFPVDEDLAAGQADFQVSSYDLYAPAWAQPPDREFRAQDENTSVAGEFVWTGFDYLGEPTPYNTDPTVLTNFHDSAAKARAAEELARLGCVPSPARSSYFGILDLAGFKKDRFFLYQARWRPELPLAHLLPHWTWPGREGQTTPVHLYTSGDEAELFLNGHSLGRKAKPPLTYRLRWDDITYTPGELTAVAYKNGKVWARAVQRTAGPPAKIQLHAENTSSGPGDLVFVHARLIDRHGTLVPSVPARVTFTLEGAGEILATDNGDPTELTPFRSPERKIFNGLALAIIRPHSREPLRLRAESPGLACTTLRIAAAPE